MTEYTVKDIGHQRIVYADRQSVGVCADEDPALKLMAKHSAANRATPRSRVQGTGARNKSGGGNCAGSAVPRHPSSPLGLNL